MKIIYLDTETTDAGEDARLVQLAYKEVKTGDCVNEYFKPPVAIDFGAMAVHHITEAMVADKPVFEGSEDKQKITDVLGDHILVAHNAPFDIGILKNEGVETKEFIDTLRIARHLLDSDSYKLQYLRYSLDFNIEAQAHDAWGDILALEKLFEHLVEEVKKQFKLETDEDILAKMQELTNMPVMIDIFLFGKHRGKSFKDVANEDRGYIEWLYNSESSKPEHEQNEDLVYTLKNHLGR